MNANQVQQRTVSVRGAALSFLDQGPADGTAVLMAHSILSSGAMWEAQARLLAERGHRVIRMDTRGHGASAATAPPYAMDDLVADTVAVMDALDLRRAHYIGLSLGGMSGVGLGIRHGDRLLSLCLCAMRADMPADAAGVWDERVAIARQAASCAPLAAPTIERWFGQPFVQSHGAVTGRLHDVAAATSVDGFEGCARAIQKLDYLPEVGRISVPVTLIVGSKDGVLPAAMRDLHQRIAGSSFAEIHGSGHLPNIDQPDAFNDILLNHFQRLEN